MFFDMVCVILCFYRLINVIRFGILNGFGSFWWDWSFFNCIGFLRNLEFFGWVNSIC